MILELDPVNMLPLPAGTQQALPVEGTGGTLQETGFRSWCVSSLVLLMKGAAASDMHAEHAVVLTVQLVLLAPRQAVSCSAIMAHGFLLASLSLLALLWEVTCLPTSTHQLWTSSRPG